MSDQTQQTDSVGIPAEPAIESEILEQLRGIQILPEAELDARKKEEWRQRVGQLRRAAGLPRRANEFCRERERVHASENKGLGVTWWADGSPWAECLERVSDAASGGGTVALLGPQGKGKTTMAVCLARAFTRTEESVRWCDVVGFILAMQDAKSGGYQQREFREWEAPKLLVIDQADKMPSAEWENRLLFRLIDQRYNDMKSTVLLCNVESAVPSEWPGEVAKKLGASVWDRIRETGIVEIAAWPALRPDLGAERGSK